MIKTNISNGASAVEIKYLSSHVWKDEFVHTGPSRYLNNITHAAEVVKSSKTAHTKSNKISEQAHNTLDFQHAVRNKLKEM